MGHGNRRRGVPLEGQMSTFTTGEGKDPVFGLADAGAVLVLLRDNALGFRLSLCIVF